jgi:peptide deformylase
MNLKLIPETSPILLQECKDFDFSNPPYDPKEFAQALHDVMVKNDGLGLSANQVGEPYKVFVIRVDNDKPFAIFNPKIVDVSERELIMKEGCLSFPGLFFHVSRPFNVVTEFFDRDNNKCIIRFDGIDARCFLHELEHLDGIFFTSKVSKFKLDLAIKKQRKRNGRTK